MKDLIAEFSLTRNTIFSHTGLPWECHRQGHDAGKDNTKKLDLSRFKVHSSRTHLGDLSTYCAPGSSLRVEKAYLESSLVRDKISSQAVTILQTNTLCPSFGIPWQTAGIGVWQEVCFLSAFLIYLYINFLHGKDLGLASSVVLYVEGQTEYIAPVLCTLLCLSNMKSTESLVGMSSWI